MAIAALRRYQSTSEFTDDSTPGACSYAVGVLLNGMVRHAAPAPAGDFDAFADRMNSLAEGIAEGNAADIAGDCNARRLLLAANSAVEALEAFNTRAAQNAADREAELHNVIFMMAEAITTIFRPGSAKPDPLVGIRHDLRSASDAESLRNLRLRLAGRIRSVVDSVVNEVAPRQEGPPAKPIAGQGPPGAGSAGQNGGDAATGSLQRKAAEDAIRTSLAHPGRKFVVTAVMDRLQAINAQYGNETGDRVLRELGLQLRRHLTSADRLYRWTGPAFTALIHREESIGQMRNMVKRIFEPPPEKEFDIDGRKVVIPIAAVWSVVALIPPATNIYSYVDRFIASQRPRSLA